MKTVTVLKILKRYEKGLSAMENEALADSLMTDVEHYKTDKAAIQQAIKIIERSNA